MQRTNRKYLRMKLFLEGVREGLAARALHEFIELGLEIENRLSARVSRRKISA